MDGGCLRPAPGADRILVTPDQVVVETVLVVPTRAVSSIESRGIGVVLAELDLIGVFEVHSARAKLLVIDNYVVSKPLQQRPAAVDKPAPGIAEPDLWQHVNGRLLRSAIAYGQPQQDVL